MDKYTELGAKGMDALKLLGSKWSIIIMSELNDGPYGFNEILRLTEGVSPRILSFRLKQMVELGFIRKKVIHRTPISTEYSITGKGQKVLEASLELLLEVQRGL